MKAPNLLYKIMYLNMYYLHNGACQQYIIFYFGRKHPPSLTSLWRQFIISFNCSVWCSWMLTWNTFGQTPFLGGHHVFQVMKQSVTVHLHEWKTTGIWQVSQHFKLSNRQSNVVILTSFIHLPFHIGMFMKYVVIGNTNIVSPEYTQSTHNLFLYLLTCYIQ